MSFHESPLEHSVLLRATNSFESMFSAMRLTADAARRKKRRYSTLYLVFYEGLLSHYGLRHCSALRIKTSSTALWRRWSMVL